MRTNNIEAILERTVTAKLWLSAFERRVQGKPGHQNATPLELLAKVEHVLDDVARLLKESTATKGV